MCVCGKEEDGSERAEGRGLLVILSVLTIIMIFIFFKGYAMLYNTVSS